MAKEILPSTTKCCCKFQLTRIIVAVYITVEIYLWAFMSIACIFCEFKMIESSSRAFKFRNFTRHSSYYAIAFGSRNDDDVKNVVVDNEVEGEGEDDGNTASENEIGQGIIGM
jgi:hypothetical protein